MASFNPIKVNGTFYIRCRGPRKKEVRFKIPSAKNKAKAERLAAEMETRYNLGIDDPWKRKEQQQSRPATQSLHELIKLYLSANASTWKDGKQGNTYHNKKYRLGILKDQIGPAALSSDITHQKINKAVNGLDIRQTSKKSYLKEYRAFLNWANGEGITDVNTKKCQLDRQPVQKLTGYISFEELEQIKETYLVDMGGKQVYADVWHFVFFNGARRNEIPGILKKDINIDQKYIRIGSDELLTKHNMENRIPIAPENMPVIEKYYEGEPNDPIFDINAKDASTKFTEAAKQTFPGRRKRWGIHLLRHSAGMHLMNVRGWHSEDVQEFLRHTSRETVEQYKHAAPAKLRGKFYDG